ncbi:hydantoinase B/oxoprolinase family protein [Octadecabacter sp. 1_MG-2023]|uniref:hydantoinase B/oxoprolinase family protein n=1 Tax=unclassified Octadecabacter TaxID=196158 RepID=UPI001C09BDDC|nr:MULTISPECIES: hydantoinase B/oxoprolinase family protein [unclassified Octadecabacter]MBU2994252.1 hydantoinase B/oxoprolinase family protein [Octadecabacter sp. B2R22]MDO6734459.1 hydantoinase B/oxoprolinase family protein [Octadecabacter sp. 1_MG-2023]
MTDKQWEFWVDRGGTFTDIVARTPDGDVRTHKLLSENPEQYADAAVQGVHDLIGTSDPALGSIAAVKMGTTVATNALLERKGEKVLLLITDGYRDLLKIGYQTRPDLFALDIVRPELLYSDVAEVAERLDAEGHVLVPLDEDAVRASLQQAFDSGLRAVAVAFLHAYLNPEHEIRVAQIASEIGFTQISASHEVSRLAKLVGRGDTTVVDAYLSPILRRYVDQVAGALDVGRVCERLFFMQSSGGLTDAARFQGRDAILSGPAGGIVGMVKTAEAAGHPKLIGFDMGGTSTDVSHYAGEYERSFETEVAGVRMRAPMMDIHTVAAGGGSICRFADGRFQVGPESAGANPGPACYRRGGPLTVTDCNVLLGKLNPEHFPQVFGPNGDQPLDVATVRAKFESLAASVARETVDTPLAVEDIAEGFLAIAVDNMANAIKKISVQRGHDVTDYTLQCFGGAGGQHACLVAEALGMSRVLIHPFAGVLSAFGMGLAELRELREVQFDAPLSDVGRAEGELAEMADDARDIVLGQGASDVRTMAWAHLRYDGTQQDLRVVFDRADAMRAAFEAAHLARFGFTSPNADILFEMLSVEAIGEGADLPDLGVKSAQNPEPVATHDRPFYNRETMGVGDKINGPAIILEPTGTNVIEAGWQAEVDPLGNLILTTDSTSRSLSASSDADPVVLEVMSNLFMSVADQMGATLANTSQSVNIKERFDFSCAIFDSAGDLVANAPHVPVHLGSMSDSIKTVMKGWPDVQDGDAFMLNSPYNGGTHLPDVTVVTPVFIDGRPRFWLGSRGHHADIGGRTPGSAPPDSQHIDEEGVLIDNMKLVSKGRFLEDDARTTLASGKYPCRNPDQNIADLKAQVAANATGQAELNRICTSYGVDVVSAYMGHVQDNAEASVRRVIDSLSDGVFSYPMDEGQSIEVSITVDKPNRTATVDFTGTSAQHTGNYNAPYAVCRAVVLYVFRTLVGSAIPLNEGCLKPLNIIAPEGTMLNPTYPAAVIAGNTEVSQATCNALFGALGVIAGSQATMNNFVWGNETFQNYETIAGGTGAGPDFNGCDAVQSHMTNTRMTDPEVLEKRFPVRLDRFEVRDGSGGAGAHVGGNGARRVMTFLEPVTVTTLCSHRIVPPFGGAGGGTGAVGRNWAVMPDGTRHDLKGNDEIDLPAGGQFVMETPGGGGWGEP